MIAALSLILTTLYTLLRLAKVVLIADFFKRSLPPIPKPYPDVSLIQPITRGATNLEVNLIARLLLEYPGNIQHLWICDQADTESQQVCERLRIKFPDANVTVLLISGKAEIASKIDKMQVGVENAHSEIYGFVDDDIEVLPDTLTVLVRCLLPDKVGAVFGLPCGVTWDTLGSSLNSLFVNSHAPMSYVPVTYFTDPFTITGHLYALRRTHFVQIGGLDNLESYLHDDHSIAVRLRDLGMRCIQTPARYRVHNHFDSIRDYLYQLKRWFVFTRQFLIPDLSPVQTLLTSTLSADVFLPTIVLLLFVLAPQWTTALSLLFLCFVFLILFYWVSSRYLGHVPPMRAWILLPVVMFVVPLFIVYFLTLSDNQVRWRGQQLRVKRGGEFEVIKL